MNPVQSSSYWRKRGTELYQNFAGSTQSYTILQEVIHCYKKALSLAKTSDERASANKNCAKISWRLIQHIEPTCYVDVMEHYQSAVDYFDCAVKDGLLSGKEMEWIDELRESLKACGNQAGHYMSKYLDKLSSNAIDRLKQSISVALERPDSDHNVPVGTAVDTIRDDSKNDNSHDDLHNLASKLRLIEELALSEQCVQALHKLRETEKILQNISSRFCNDPLEVEKLQDRQINLLAYTHAIRQFQEGARIYAGDDPDMVLEAMDCYRRCLEYAAECNIKVPVQAEAYGGLGEIYLEVRNYPDKARQCFEKALEMTVPGKMPDEWEMDIQRSIDCCENKIIQQREKERATKTGDLVELSEQADIWLASGHISQLIIYICHNFPPKISNFMPPPTDEMATMTNNKLKLILLKMFRCYHPDKNQSYGHRWLLACQEICIILNKVLM